MTLPASGPLKFSDINLELRKTSNAPLSLGSTRTLANVPSGPIKMSNLRGKTHEIVVTMSNANSPVIVSYFDPSVWSSNIQKRVVIPAGVTIGATNISYALAISYDVNGQAGNFGGTLIIDNYGEIRGMGGAANSGVGGNCLWTPNLGKDGNKLIVNNYGAIRAGGGGGGRGGNGGDGSYVGLEMEGPFYQTTAPVSYVNVGLWGILTWYWDGSTKNGTTIYNEDGSYTLVHTDGWTYHSVTMEGPSGNTVLGIRRERPATFSSIGGTGGNGARGQGFDGAAGTGANGAAGGTNAGTGGKGGNGGGWGAGGATGSAGTNGNVSNGTSGLVGGLAGLIASVPSNVTINNSGTLQGR